MIKLIDDSSKKRETPQESLLSVHKLSNYI